MPALPHQDKLIVPIEWSVTPIKQTMQAGSYTLSGTIGWRPWTETTTLTWSLPKADALALLAEFKSGNFNRVYDYSCNVRGAIRIRPTTACGFGETFGSLNTIVTLSVEVV
jgi:hypothetical protein